MSNNDANSPDVEVKKLSRRGLLRLACWTSAALGPFSMLSALADNATSEISSPLNEDGYRAWLRYNEIEDAQLKENYRRSVTNVFVAGESDILQSTRSELSHALSLLLGKQILSNTELNDGSIVVGTKSSPFAKAISAEALAEIGPDGFTIQSSSLSGHDITAIIGENEVGTLYGAFAFLRLLLTGQPISQLKIVDNPKNPLRTIAHWDNMDGTVERGYGGSSLWNWDYLPDKVDGRLKDYARLCSSIGINRLVLNNVNANPAYLQSEHLRKAAALANVFRAYGIRVFLAPNFDAPRKLGSLATADPKDARVKEWWRVKTREIYALIPDFAGFLVKANSEGIPGPQDYGRTHADGANMLAEAVAPHGGIVMWRAFVYTVGNQDPDRVKRAYEDFQPLDGKFADNVLVQVKTGPLDFQPREPFHPLFGAMPKTRLTAELQITQEYMGQSTHLVYLAPLWKEVLDSDTHCDASHSSVAEVIERFPHPGRGGMTGDANVGSDRNWCGHHFAQANWYAYGRLAWSPTLTSEAIADEWIKMTWSHSPDVIAVIRQIMLDSHEAYVDYTMPLGLHHMVGGDHYAPLPEGEGDPRGIFHHASTDGIGYDRTRTGSDAVDQYHAPLNDQFNDLKTCPEKFLLWFHHLPWDYQMKSGSTLWQELCLKYDSGVKTARDMEALWLSLHASRIDRRRFKEVSIKLHQQAVDAQKWADKCLNYFAQFSKLSRP